MASGLLLSGRCEPDRRREVDDQHAGRRLQVSPDDANVHDVCSPVAPSVPPGRGQDEFTTPTEKYEQQDEDLCAFSVS